MNVNHRNTPRRVDQDALVFEDNFNVLSQAINNAPATSFAVGNKLAEEEIDASTSTNQNETIDANKPFYTKSYKYLLLGFFSSIYLLYGMSISLFGPSLPDFLVILNTKMEYMSYSVSIRSAVYCFSTILVNLSFKKIGGRQFQYSIAVILFAIFNGLLPLMTSFNQYLISVIFQSFFSSFIDSVTNLVVLELFSLNSKLFVQIAHFSYTLGTALGPIFVSPFLSKNSTITDISSHTNSSSLLDLQASNNLYIPFFISNGLLLIGGVLMIILQIIKPYVPEKRKLVAKNKSKRYNLDSDSILEGSSSNSYQNSFTSNVSNQPHSTPKKEVVVEQINLPKIYYFTLIGLTGFLLSVYCCIEYLSNFFMPTFLQKSELKVDQRDAALMASVVSITMTIGRLCTIIFAFKTTCKILLFSNLFTISFGYISLTYFSIHSRVLIWFSLGVLGFGYSSTYPLVLSFIENRIIITNTIQLFLLFSGVIFTLFIPLFMGFYLDSNPMIFLYVNLSLSILVVSLMFCIHFTDVWKRKLIRKLKEDRQILVQEQY